MPGQLIFNFRVLRVTIPEISPICLVFMPLGMKYQWAKNNNNNNNSTGAKKNNNNNNNHYCVLSYLVYPCDGDISMRTCIHNCSTSDEIGIENEICTF